MCFINFLTFLRVYDLTGIVTHKDKVGREVLKHGVWQGTMESGKLSVS